MLSSLILAFADTASGLNTDQLTVLEHIRDAIGGMTWGERNRAEMFVLLEHLKWNFPELHDIVEPRWAPYRDAVLVQPDETWRQKFD